MQILMPNFQKKPSGFILNNHRYIIRLACQKFNAEIPELLLGQTVFPSDLNLPCFL